MTRIKSFLIALFVSLGALGIINVSHAPRAAAAQDMWAAVQDGVNYAASKGVTQYVYVMGRHTGQPLAWTGNAWAQVASESLVKMHIAAYQLHRYGGNGNAVPCDMWSMITNSANEPASACWSNDIMSWASRQYDLRGSYNNPKAPGW